MYVPDYLDNALVLLRRLWEYLRHCPRNSVPVPRAPSELDSSVHSTETLGAL